MTVLMMSEITTPFQHLLIPTMHFLLLLMVTERAVVMKVTGLMRANMTKTKRCVYVNLYVVKEWICD